MKKALYISAGIIGFIILTVIIAVHVLKTRGLPDYNKNISLKGIEAKVEVYRDRYGVPSIYASSLKDLYFATGYVMAQDRIWQMDLLRRVTMGRLSEIFGEKLVNTDELFRTLRITEKSRKILTTITAQERENLKAFCAGVNRCLKDNDGNLPLEFVLLGYTPEKWEPVHSVNLIGFMAWDLTVPWKTEVAAQKVIEKVGFKKYSHIMPKPDKTKEHVYNYTDTLTPGKQALFLDSDALGTIHETLAFLEDMGLTVFDGSNNWAVSGKRTKSGKPMFANDMHLGLNSPGIWYQIHQHAPGVHVLGLALPGEPFVVAGHNEHISWGMTNVTIDNADFYLEKVKKDKDNNPVEYLYNGTWRKIKTRTMKIHVKGKEEPVIRTMYLTKNGPIVSSLKKIKGHSVSMRWGGNIPSNEMRGVYQLNRAENWKEFKKAAANFISVSQNILYADVEGNIAMYAGAGIPIRKRKAGTFYYDGWNDTYSWKGMVPFEKQPHEKNPKCGVLASANNKVVSNDYPYYITMWYYPPNRYNRILQTLLAKDNHTVDDFMKLQTDQVSLLPKKFMPVFLGAIDKYRKSDAYKKDPEHKESFDAIQKTMKAWDYSMARTSKEAALFEVFYNRFMRNTLLDEMGEELYREFIFSPSSTYYAMEQLWLGPDNPWFDNVMTDTKESKYDIIIATLKEMIDEGLGIDEIDQWGDIHQFTMKHPMGSKKILDFLFGLNRGPFPMGGSFHTVCPYSYRLDREYQVYHGASHRIIHDLSDWDNSRIVLPTGISGIAGSDHYLDQTEEYVAGKYHHIWFTKEKVVENARYSMEFMPELN